MLRTSRRIPDYPKNTEFKLKFGPRHVIECTATTTETPGEDPRFGKWGKQNCEDTGPLDKKRMGELWFATLLIARSMLGG